MAQPQAPKRIVWTGTWEEEAGAEAARVSRNDHDYYHKSKVEFTYVLEVTQEYEPRSRCPASSTRQWVSRQIKWEAKGRSQYGDMWMECAGSGDIELGPSAVSRSGRSHDDIFGSDWVRVGGSYIDIPCRSQYGSSRHGHDDLSVQIRPPQQIRIPHIAPWEELRRDNNGRGSYAYEVAVIDNSLGDFSRGVLGGNTAGALPGKTRYNVSVSPYETPFCQEMRAENPTAAKLFESLYVTPSPTVVTPAATMALLRFLRNCEGVKLLNELSRMPCPPHWNAPVGPPVGCTMGSYIRFTLQFKDRVPGSSEAGHVSPPDPYPDPATADPELLKKFFYTVSVTNEVDRPPGPPSRFPRPESSCFAYNFSDGSSEMATTIYHELLHILWMNERQTNHRNSGHGPDLEDCNNYDSAFVDRLEDFYGVMDRLEKCLKTNPIP